MGRTVMHMDMDTFFVSVERLKNAALIGKPVLIGGGSDRGVVASCSYEARAFGVHSAMPMRLARRLCPQAIIISGDYEDYSKFSGMVTEIIEEKAPVYEKSSIDEFYLDLTGMDKFFGCYQWAQELRETIIKETGLPISFAVSVNKLVSKIGTGLAKPNGHKDVPAGTEKPFIAPLPVQKIPMVGEKTLRQLVSMGVRTISTLREMPLRLLEREFGKNGISLWEKANALDETPVIPYREQKSLSKERTFHTDTTDMYFLKTQLTSMVEELAFELRQIPKLTSCVTVKIRYSDFNTETMQHKIGYTASDEVLLKIAHDLFDKLYSKRMLLRLIGVRFSGLVHGHPQIHLFHSVPEMVSLCQAMDHIRNKHGTQAVYRCSGMGGERRIKTISFNGK